MFLAKSLVSVRSRKFWAYHRAILRTIGHPLRRLRLLRALMAELVGFPLYVERAWRALAEIRRTRALAARVKATGVTSPRETSAH